MKLATLAVVCAQLMDGAAWAQVNISPGTNIQTVIDMNSAGTTYVLQAGTHREQTITPKTGDTFQGELSGTTRLTTLSGARVLSSWTTSGSLWYATGQTQQGTTGYAEDCLASHPQCIYPEDLWFDSVIKFREASQAATGPGEWYFDYAADRIYVGDDPSGHTVETSVTPNVFLASSADTVTIKDMIVEKYASSVGGTAGAVNLGYSPFGAEFWTAQNLEVRWNHYAGIGLDSETTATGNYVHHNCNSGFFGAGANLNVASNEIAYNGIAAGTIGTPCGFTPYWGSGGTKFVYTSDLRLTSNRVHHNYGSGLWLDINNVDAIYDGNTIYDNIRSGIFHEISFAAIIRNNVISHNGIDTYFGDYPTNGCIEILSSPNVEVYGNVCVDNAGGIMVWDDARDLGDIDGDGSDDSLAVVNTQIHDNFIAQAGSEFGFQGLINTVDDSASGAPFQSGANNDWYNNSYCLSGGKDPYFRWAGADKTNAQWQAAGMDTAVVNFLNCTDTRTIRIRQR